MANVTIGVVIDGGDALDAPGRFTDMDIVRLNDGGFALLGNDSADLEIDIFDQNGVRSPTIITGAGPGGTLAQLGNGDLIVAHELGGSVQFVGINTSGSDGPASVPVQFSVFTGTTNADIGAGASSFAIVSQLAVSATDSNIELEIYGVSPDGGTAGLAAAFAIDGTSALDTDASVAVLANGNVAVAWTRTNDLGTPEQNTDVMYAVYSADGTEILGPSALADGRDVNQHASVAATVDGGFAVAFESRVFDDQSIDIRMNQFDENGVRTSLTQVSNRFFEPFGFGDDSDDARPFVSVGPDGNIAISYTTNVDGNADTVVAVVKDGKVLADTTANFSTSEQQQTGSVVSFFGTGQIAVFDALDGTGAEGQRLTGDRDGAGDANGNPTNDVLIGDDFTDLLNGLDGDDTLRGGGNVDTMFGGEGQDVMSGDAGDDMMFGEGGSDVMEGGAGDDTIEGNGGDDIIYAMTEADIAGSTDGDTIFGGAGHDQIFGSSGADVIDGGTDSDDITGGDGGDRIDGGAGADTMEGGAGDDTYVVDTFADTIFEDADRGSDTVLARSSYALAAGASIEVLRTIDDAATTRIDLTGNELGQSLTGNAGDNVLNGRGGADTMTGGAGDDSYFVDTGADKTIETLAGAAGGTDTVFSTVNRTLGDNLEILRLAGAANLNGVGNELDNQIFGNGGVNVLRGLGGRDTLSGGGGDDRLDGGEGDDRLDGGAGADNMTGGRGDDVYIVDAGGDQTVETTVGATGGVDTVFSSVNRTLGDNLEILRLTGTADLNGKGNALDNQIFGNAHDNVLFGQEGNDTLDGGAGADTLHGDGGSDTMTGGTGSDSYFVDSGGDQTIETVGGAAGGVDTVFSSVNRTLGDNLEILRLTGTADLNGRGNALANQIFGNAGANVLNGDAGNDRMFGGAGDDRYFVDAGGDQTTETLAGTAGGVDTVFSTVNRTLGANLENLTLQGAADLNGVGNELGNRIVGNGGANVLRGLDGSDDLVGGGGGDRLDGGVGSDLITGGAGDDRLTGGSGSDLFVFEASKAGADTITDFQAADDRFIISGHFLSETESGGNTLLTHVGGSITVLGVAGLTLDDWNGLIALN